MGRSATAPALVLLVAAAVAVPAARSDRAAGCAGVPVGSARIAYAGWATHGAVAFRRPGGRAVVARFGAENANAYPTVLGIVGEADGRACGGRWYRVQLPVRPNGATGWVRAGTLVLERVRTRIVVDLSQRRLWLYRDARVVLRARVGVGSPATPTPAGRFYVNQRLVPDDPSGPYGPAALGISAYSPVLTWWRQGGPIAIHGTDDPSSIGQARSNGCIRLENATLRRVFAAAGAGTPVVVRP
ncbi:MAG TPA: L,D-transpeptidase [Gaiellaceae bacterium]|jgi:lipoprotein-anchoring transpeptidase ErfK/SrfK